MRPLSSPIYIIYLNQDRKKKPKGAIKVDESVKASPSGSGRNSPAIAGTSDERQTAAEKRFQEVQRKRVRLFTWCPTTSCIYVCAMQLADKVKKLAGKTHKDRVHDFNAKLETLSEHHDIPKVSIVPFETGWCPI
jgi:protein FAM32A